jgi:hypothetical protein
MPTAARRHRLRRIGATALVAAALLSACGGDDDDDATASAVEDDDGSDGGETRAAADRCPLSAEQVSAALGAPVDKDEPSCTFYPADDVLPNATFVRQVAFACDGDLPAELGYEGKLDGLGVETFVQPDVATGTQILVCTDAPFEIVIDMGGDSGPEIEAAMELARLVLGD